MIKNVQTLHCLVGEQQISNLIPIKHINPVQVVFWHTKFTFKKCELLQKELKAKKINSITREIDPYHLGSIISDIEKQIEEDRQVNGNSLMFNLTGGTKTMAMGSFLVCQKYNVPFCYLQSENGKNNLHYYTWESNMPILEGTSEISNIIDLDEYIKIHVGEYNIKEKDQPYEELIFNCLKDQVDEIKSNIYLEAALEVDLVFRIGNQVGIAEVKTGGKAEKKEGIDQLSTAGGREYFGTYTKKFLIVDREYPTNNKDLAMVRGIKVIELKNSPRKQGNERIDEKDKEFLIQSILSEMKH